MNFKEQFPGVSVAFTIGAILPALIGMNIFATNASLESLRADIAQNYVTKIDIEKRLDRIENYLEKLDDHIRGKKL